MIDDLQLILRENDLVELSDEELFDMVDEYYTPDAAMSKEELIMSILQEEFGYDRVKAAHPECDQEVEEAQERFEARDVKYPHIKVQLTGNDGNAFAVMGRVSQALRRAKVSSEEIHAFTAEAMSGNYDDLLATCMRWVDCR